MIYLYRTLLISILILILIVISPVYSFEYWNQNDTYFIRLSFKEVCSLSWQNSFPSKNSSSLIVNGTYFNRYNREPVAFIKRWKNLYFDQPCNIPPRPLLFLPLNDFPLITYSRNNMGRWSIGGGPTLIENSEINIKNKEEKFRYDIRISKKFTALGVTENKKLIIVTTFNRTMQDIAWCLKFLNCTEAMRLDGGSSTYIYVENEIKKGYMGNCSNYLYLSKIN